MIFSTKVLFFGSHVFPPVILVTELCIDCQAQELCKSLFPSVVNIDEGKEGQRSGSVDLNARDDIFFQEISTYEQVGDPYYVLRALRPAWAYGETLHQDH